LSKYQPVGQSAKFTAAGVIARDANPTLATANAVAADRAILSLFMLLVLFRLVALHRRAFCQA
jgi:hypothetical protein